MQLIAPDILLEGRGMTGAMAGTIFVLGLALWLFGWRWHRFWVVSGITLTAGIIGLNAGQAAGGQVLAVGLLLAVAAGMMALELARVIAFVAGGVGAWFAAQWVLPQAQELWAVFLSGGLFGLLLYRVWTMLLTSLAGTLLAGHAGLLLLEPLLNTDVSDWATRNVVALNGAVVTFAVMGLLLQVAASPEPEAKSEPAEKAPKKKRKSRKKPKHDHPREHEEGEDHEYAHGPSHGKRHGHHDDEEEDHDHRHDEKPVSAGSWWKRLVRKAA